MQVFWTGATLGLLLLLHVPLLLVVRRQIAEEQEDEAETQKAHQLQEFFFVKRGGAWFKRKSFDQKKRDEAAKPKAADLPPDLRDALMSTFPKYECWLGPSQFRGTPDCNESAAFVAQLRPGCSLPRTEYCFA